ncbi:MAG TPA: hypothetical protein VE998_11230 [Terriglobales bacterium]|nr:hypothetical protein [Terriglobales bacterium]
MRKRISLSLLSALFAVAVYGQATPPCPGYNAGKNNNLACELPTATRTSTAVVGTGTQTLGSLSPTLATALSQLPVATAVSGTGLSFSRSLGMSVATNDSLGSILTQRGETIGRHNFYVSMTYQRFSFDSIDGIDLKNLKTVNSVNYSSGQVTYNALDTRVDLRVDQFTGLASFGLTSRLDFSMIVPFSKVTMASGTAIPTPSGYGTLYVTSPNAAPFAQAQGAVSYPGSAFGIGDIVLNGKGTVYNGERTKVALGTDFRFKTGDETNYLGTGAYGVKPYVVISHRGRKLTPHANVGYQWNGVSPLTLDANGQHNLPGSVDYAGGLDWRAAKKLTIVGEFLGQYVINAPRVQLISASVPGAPGGSLQTVSPYSGSYAMDNGAIGFKANPVGGLMITANAMFKLDDAGLRARVVPLFGISYRFGR